MIALHDLLSVSDEASFNAPVCTDGGDVLDRAAFRERVAAWITRVQAQGAQRYALCLDDPFDFACALFALFACGKEPVIPANATPGYLADLADALLVARAIEHDDHHVADRRALALRDQLHRLAERPVEVE